MWNYEKKLQYPVNIKNPNPTYAKIIMTQYGGPDGELGASLRYLSQRFSMPYAELKGLLTDIGTEYTQRPFSYFSISLSPDKISASHCSGAPFKLTFTLPFSSRTILSAICP